MDEPDSYLFTQWRNLEMIKNVRVTPIKKGLVRIEFKATQKLVDLDRFSQL